MKNMIDLRDRLSNVFDQLEQGDLDTKKASELTNIAGKLINSAKVELEYQVHQKRVVNIPFLEGDDSQGDRK